jgi:hypothetical protein
MQRVNKIKMSGYASMNTLKSIWNSIGYTQPNFDTLIALLDTIQRQGKIPLLSQIEDVLPLELYDGINRYKSFDAFIRLAEKQGIVFVNREERDPIIVLLKPKTGNTPLFQASDFKVSFQSNKQLEYLKVIGMVKMRQLLGTNYKKVDGDIPIVAEQQSLRNDHLSIRNRKLQAK